MSTKMIKRENVKFGEYEVAVSDTIRVSQEDGSGTGFTVGLVASKAGRDKYSLLPFARVLELNGIDRVSSSVFNDYTRVWKDERKAAEAVRKLCNRFAITLGERTQELLSEEVDERKTVRVTKTTAEKVAQAFKAAKSKGAYLDIASVSWTELKGAVSALVAGNTENVLAARAVVEEMAKFVKTFNEKHAPATQK